MNQLKMIEVSKSSEDVKAKPPRKKVSKEMKERKSLLNPEASRVIESKYIFRKEKDSGRC